ncbi:DUF262 domain-containing protein (plasmid) [Campylobacterota bacterium DY0563]
MNMKLKQVVEEVKKGSIVLPDFQRNFVWGPEDVRQLLVSIFGGYFIGSLLFLDSLYNENIPFAVRLIRGVESITHSNKISNLVKIVLDGQQRITALFYAFYSPKVPINPTKKHPHIFYIDILRALDLFKIEKKKSENNLDYGWDDIIYTISLANKKKIKEYANSKYVIPVSSFYDLNELVRIFNNDDKINIADLVEFHNRVIENYEIHIVSLPKDTTLDKIVETFERLNKTGMPLSIFDLATARLYKYNINLRNLLKDAGKKFSFVDALKPETILKVITLIREREPARRNLLEIDHNDFEIDWWRACEFLEKAYIKITDIKDGYGVVDFKKWAPYSSIIVPVAALLEFLNKNHLEDVSSYSKIDIFYWTSVFSNHYEHSVDSITYSDYKSMKKWINTDKMPEFIKNFDVNSVDLDVSTASSAIFRGIINLIVLKGAYDFKTGQPPQFAIPQSKIQIDHIFPKSIYGNYKDKDGNIIDIDQIANRTLITTNQSKSNKKPSEYFSDLLRQHGRDKLIEILSTHIIPEEGLDYLLQDDLENFLAVRKKAIKKEIIKRINEGV